jgi:hypothetical protein
LHKPEDMMQAPEQLYQLKDGYQEPTKYFRAEVNYSILGQIQNFQSQLSSILRWAVELGWLDVYILIGQLGAIFHIYRYIHTFLTMVFDNNFIFWNDDDFPSYDWLDFYHDAQEDTLKNAPEPKGIPVQMNVFVDVDHAGNKLTIVPTQASCYI